MGLFFRGSAYKNCRTRWFCSLGDGHHLGLRRVRNAPLHGGHTFAVKLFQNHPDIREGDLEVVQLFSLLGVCQGGGGGGVLSFEGQSYQPCRFVGLCIYQLLTLNPELKYP